MKSIKKELSKDIDKLEIYALGDLHIGDKQCDLKGIKNILKEIESKENAYAILNGDLINNAIKSSVSDIYSEKLSPMKQVSTLVDLLKPIKDKILVVTNGNHENRTYKTDGIDILHFVSNELGISDAYSNGAALLFLRFGENSKGLKYYNSKKIRKIQYTFYINHGSGGGKRYGGKANALESMAGIIDADIYIHSHTHLPLIFKDNFYRVDTRNSTYNEVTKLFINTNAFINYGGYGEAFEYKPSSRDVIKIKLSGLAKKYTAEL